MQTLDVISVNIWQIVISLINLVLLFFILKKFLFKPVQKVLSDRQKTLDEQYFAAKRAEDEATEHRLQWEKQLSQAEEQANAILQSATENAKQRGDKLIAEAKERADGMLRVAQTEAELERKKAEEGVKREIVEVSGALTQKILEREINTEDHHALIDSFIDKLGEDDE